MPGSHLGGHTARHPASVALPLMSAPSLLAVSRRAARDGAANTGFRRGSGRKMHRAAQRSTRTQAEDCSPAARPSCGKIQDLSGADPELTPAWGLTKVQGETQPAGEPGRNGIPRDSGETTIRRRAADGKGDPARAPERLRAAGQGSPRPRQPNAARCGGCEHAGAKARTPCRWRCRVRQRGCLWPAR
jgi:hypothetical protein